MIGGACVSREAARRREAGHRLHALAGGHAPRSPPNDRPPKPRPHLILLPDADIAEGDVECRDEADVLAFKVSLTSTHRERLRPAIATVLAQAHRIVTRAAGLLLLAFHESFDAWADAHPKATDEERAQAWEPPAKKYTRNHWAETSAVLQQWGFPALSGESADR